MLLKKKQCRDWRLYAITCPEGLGGRDLVGLAEAAIRGGADVLQLRDKKASDADFLAMARLLSPLTRRLGVPLVINDRLRLAKECGADGVHLGQEDGSLAEARRILGDNVLIGRSTHSPEQALSAEREGFDYVGVGPVYATPTKPGRTPVGLELVRFAADHLKIPFVAIGGIDEGNIQTVLDAGARCVALVRALLGSNDPETAARMFLRKMKRDSNGAE